MDQSQSLYNYLLNSAASSEKQQYLDLISYEVNQKIYHFGDHFRTPREAFPKYIDKIKDQLLASLAEILYTFPTRKISINPTYFTSAYFQFEKKISANCCTKKNPWILSPFECSDAHIVFACRSFMEEMKHASLDEVLSDRFFYKSAKIKEALKKHYQVNNIKAAFFSNDMSYWDRLGILICKELCRPSYIFLHGLPARYNHLDDNRSDYLLVWGEQIKKNYVRAGFSPDKIFVTGHPKYATKAKEQKIKTSLEDIMIVSHSLSGAPHSVGNVFSDRGNLITYLKTIQTTLQQLGVKKARLRPHPSENPRWYKHCLGTSFFEIENRPLEASIKHSTLLIGAPSTVLIESLYLGINYIVFDPDKNGVNMVGARQVPPFDGTDNRICVTKTPEELKRALVTPSDVKHVDFLSDYIKTPFQLPQI